MKLDLFEVLTETAGAPLTDLKDLSSEFASTQACCEEGQCCADPW